MLEIEGISSKAGSFRLKQVSITVPKACCHVIVGPTGSGKTLLLESIIGLKKPEEGRILVDGRDVTHLSIEKRGISYVPQDLALFPHMSVRKNVLYSSKIRGMKVQSHNNMVTELVESLGIANIFDRSIKNLSGGERQRTALARAVASGCNHLLLDEPLSSLHESLKKDLWFLLKELQKKYDLTLLVVTHDLEEAFFLGDLVSVMIGGRVQQTGGKREVHQQPQTLEVARFLGIRNLFHSRGISGSGGMLSVFCRELGVNLSFSARNTGEAPGISHCSGTELIVGIRSTDVDMRPWSSQEANLSNVLKCKVLEVWEKGGSTIVTALPEGSTKQIEVEIQSDNRDNWGVTRGELVALALSPEKLHVLPSERSVSGFGG